MDATGLLFSNQLHVVEPEAPDVVLVKFIDCPGLMSGLPEVKEARATQCTKIVSEISISQAGLLFPAVSVMIKYPVELNMRDGFETVEKGEPLMVQFQVVAPVVVDEKLTEPPIEITEAEELNPPAMGFEHKV